MDSINWWEIGDIQNLHLSKKELNFIKRTIEDKFKSLYTLDKELGLKRGLYNKFKYKNQGITVKVLKNVLNKLNIPYGKIGNQKLDVGRYNVISLKFPLNLKPLYGELLAHAFFDGYCDDHILRYSNYDGDIRNEFCSIVKKIFHNVKINKPKNLERCIDLPAFIPKLLKSVFDIDTFYSNRCRIPKKFFNLVQRNNLFGWYFLKGAYIDEGTITGKQIWIVRGIKNQGLVKDVKELTKILSLKTKIREDRKYVGLMVRKESYDKFYTNISRLIINPLRKWKKVRKKIENWKIHKKREEKVIIDCRKIIKLLSKRKYVTTKEIQEVCNLTKSTAYFRLHLLIYNGNLKKQRKGKKNIYLLKNRDLLVLPNMNKMRKEFGWR